MLEAKDLGKLAAALSVSEDELQRMMTGHVNASGKGIVKTDPVPQAAAETKFYLSQPPRLPTFSGDNLKGESGYDSWRSEVDKLQLDKSLTTEEKQRVVWKSLQGKAGRVAKRLGSATDLTALLAKLDNKFTCTARGQQLMREFYASQQREDENVSSWSCRLEDLLDQAKDAKRVQDGEIDELLREQFWTGLRCDLQEGTEHKYDSIKNFDDLEDAIRQVERDRKLKGVPKKTPAHHGTSHMSQSSTSERSDLQELKQMFQHMNKKMDVLQHELQQLKAKPPHQSPHATAAHSQPSTQVRRCFTCGDPSHLRPDCPQRRQPQSRQCGSGRGAGSQRDLPAAKGNQEPLNW